MGVPYTLNKSYRNHFGLDLKSTDLTRGEGFASKIKNAEYSSEGDVRKRRGFQAKLDNSSDIYSLFEYNRFQPVEMSGLEPAWDDNTVNIAAGDSDNMMIGVGDRVHRKRSVDLTISYSGSNASVFALLFLDPISGQYRFQIDNNGTIDLDVYLGLKVDGGSYVTVSELQAQIDALADYSATANPSAIASTTPAAFLDVSRPLSLASSQTLSADYWDELPQESATQTSSVSTNASTDAFEPPTAARAANVLYITNGYDDLLKYDGQYVYRAGLPMPDEDQIVLTQRNNLTYNRSGSAFSYGLGVNNWFSYRFQYAHRDAAGNIIEGNLTQRFTVQTPGSTVGSVTIDSDAAEAGSTDTVINATAHSAEIGDTITFTSGALSGQSKQVSDISTDTITVVTAFTGAPSAGDTFDVEQTGAAGVELEVPVIEDTTGFNTRYLEFEDSVGSPSATQTVVSSAGWYPGDVLWLYDYETSQSFPIASGKSPDAFKQVRIVEVPNSNTVVLSEAVEIRDSTTGVAYRRSNIGSNGTTLLVWRSTAAASAAAAEGLDHYLVGEFPLNPEAGGTITILDALSDEVLNRLNPSSSGGLVTNPVLVSPVVDRSPPPKGRYIFEFRNLLVMAGDLQPDQSFVDPKDTTYERFPNTIAWSDVDNPEYFPNNTNLLNVSISTNDKITGIAGNNNTLIVFKNRSADAISGDLALGNIRVDPIIDDIGCASHHTIQEVRGYLYFLSERGPYMMIGGQNPIPIGNDRVEPIFRKKNLFVNKRCIAASHTYHEQYILYCPRTDGSDPTILVYDYNKEAWLQWADLEMSNGLLAFGSDLYYTNSSNQTFKQLQLNDSWDYADNSAPIKMTYADQWEALGEPSILKRYLSARIFKGDNEISNNLSGLTLKTEVNYTPDDTKANVAFDFVDLGYGTSAYGTTAYGSPAEPAKEKKLSPGRFRSLRVIFENNNIHECPVIQGWELQIATRYKGVFKS